MPTEIVKSYLFFATLIVMLIIGFGCIIMATVKIIKQRIIKKDAE
jgi:hypothetical protein